MSSTKCYGAVLEHAEDSGRDFDVWVITNDFETIIKAPDSDVVLCQEDEHDRDALMRLVEAKHDAPFGCTMIVDHRPSHRGYRRNRRNHDDAEGWRVLKWPLVEEAYDNPISTTRVRSLCAEHGTILVDASGMAKLYVSAEVSANKTALRALGFVVTTSGDYFKLRWNALSAAMQNWRETSKSTSTRLVPFFTEEALAKVGYCVNPTNWPSSHPYNGMLSGREDYGFHGRPVDRYGNALRRGSTGYKTEFSKYKIDEILKFVALNRKLCPKLKPWLEITNYYRGSSYEPALKVALEACFDNIHAVEMVAKRERVAKRGASALEKKAARDAAVTLQFCRWLRAQAKVLKVALPKPPKLPPKPTRQSLKEKGTL